MTASAIGFTSCIDLLIHGRSLTISGMLHVLNGDATRTVLERAGVPGEILVWTDILHDGPAPADVAGDAWRQLRARHLASRGAGTDAEILAELRDRDDRLEQHARRGDHAEVVFWFEHDLFDQLLLIRHLHWLSERVPDSSRFRLICIGAFPGRADFHGLGELSPDELATLFPRRQPLTGEQLALGSALWRAFGGADPRPFSDLVITGNTSALPFAAGALRRVLEDYPSIMDGLSRTERQILEVVREGRQTAVDAFRAAAHLEERIFMGDSTFFAIMRELTDAPEPLLAHSGTFSPHHAPTGIFTLTRAGESVLMGHDDHIRLNGIDRWIGGVHLTDGRYRWTGKEVIRV